MQQIESEDEEEKSEPDEEELKRIQEEEDEKKRLEEEEAAAAAAEAAKKGGKAPANAKKGDAQAEVADVDPDIPDENDPNREKFVPDLIHFDKAKHQSTEAFENLVRY